MPLWFRPATSETPTTLEVREKRISLVVSLLAVALMLSGFGVVMAGSAVHSVLERSALPLASLPYQMPNGWAAMSLGIILLGLLPLGRLTLAVAAYGQERNWRDCLVALLVMVELLLSIFLGG